MLRIAKPSFYKTKRKGKHSKLILLTTYEYILRLRDQATSSLQRVAKAAGITDKRINNVDAGMKRANRTTNVWSNSLKTLKKVAVAAFAGIALTSFTSKVIDARQEYEKYNAVLTNTFQSAEVGESALQMLTDFASKTPFQLNNLTGAFVKLANRGFTPAENQLRSLGDLASSQGKSFDQLAEAVLDAETNEFERLKEFGIKASKSGDQVSFSFKGLTKTVDANSESIRNAILEYGNMEGVSGAMDAISKTLGGRISNLKDRWNSFLVAVGGQSSGVFNGVIDLLNSGLTTLTEYLPYISAWFSTLWEYLKPVGAALWNFIKAAFGFSEAGDAVGAFGSIMQGVLFVADLLTTGLVTIINWLTPFADVIGIATLAWVALNTAFAISPIGWIVIGIMALIAAIGLVMKYTSGWGDNFQFTTKGMKLIMEAFVLKAKADFNTLVNGLMIGIEMIQRGWYRFKESVGMGDSSENQKMISDLNQSIEQRKQSIIDGYGKAASKAKEAVEAFGIKIDTEGMKKDFASLKEKFSGFGEGEKSNTAYQDFLNKNKGTNALDANTPGGMSSKNTKADSIVTGGKRTTNINVTINEVGTGVQIHVDKAEKGINDFGRMVREELLRAINSINQMQTA